MSVEVRELRRPIVIGVCPACAGQGVWADCESEPMALVTCERCDGSGDLDSYRLMAAYEQGRQDASGDVSAALRQVQAIVDRPSVPMTPERLRQLIGG